MSSVRSPVTVFRSLPTRGGWIEMMFVAKERTGLYVPPHTGRVD